MRVDAHNACAACPQPVRNLYYAAQQLLDQIDQNVQVVRDVEALRQAARAFAPHIDAHHANQNHVLSPELASAREPVCR